LLIFCAAVTITTLNFWISYLFRPTRLSYYSSKLSDVWEKLTFQIRQNYPAAVGFLPEPDFCRIWKKCRIPTRAGAGAEIWCSPTWLTPDSNDIIWQMTLLQDLCSSLNTNFWYP